jgi:uncharacterized membrane protein (UPF0127 family)
MNRSIHNAKQKKVITILIAILALSAVAYAYRCGVQKTCGSSVVEQVVRKEVTVTAPRGTITAEVVDTASSREQGLSGRLGLGEDKGMLFIFDHPGKYGFWMKDMLFAIDIVWINEDGIVVHVERNISPSSYFVTNPPQTFINTPEALYVLEVAAGESEEKGLYLGTKVELGG